MPSKQARLPEGTVGYLIVYAMPLLVVVSVWLGQLSGAADLLAWLPLAMIYLFVPLYQENHPRESRRPPTEVLESQGWRRWYRLVPLFAPLPQLVMIAVAAWAWSAGGLAPWGRLGLLLGTGALSTLFGINIAHTLMHRREALDRMLAGILLSMLCFGSFRIVHLHIHHPHVGTAGDFASAPRGRGFYRYWFGCLAGNFTGALRVERARLAKSRLPWWRSELVPWTLLSLLWLAGFVTLFGPAGGVFFLLHALVAVTQLDLVNYIQHYGLARRALPGGGFEPVGSRHAWSQALYIDDLLLLNLPRHAEHHAHPQRPFEELEVTPDTPRYPHGYAVMILLALVPPLFRRIVDPRLDRMDFAVRPAVAS